MPREYTTAKAFRRALEVRLGKVAAISVRVGKSPGTLVVGYMVVVMLESDRTTALAHGETALSRL